MTYPNLTLADLTDEKLPGKIDQLFEGNKRFKKLSQEIIRAQNRLQEITSDDHWFIYLDVESTANIRLDYMLRKVALWSYHQGRKNRGK